MEKETREKTRKILENYFNQPANSFLIYNLSSSSLNQTYRLQFNNEIIFCKLNSANKFPQLFRKESAGLKFLAENSNFKIPHVIGHFEFPEQVLLMEWIEPGEKTKVFWKNFGKQLAEMHRVNSDSFGWLKDNYMGVVPQSNNPHKNWNEFFRAERLEPLCRLCSNKGLLQNRHLDLFNKLFYRLDEIFNDGNPPSLVHGDLWNGNFIAGKNDQAVLIDPAVCFGHPSIDLGMTTLFGGFPELFYESYQYHYPFSSNYRQQWKLANLYPLLIHLYLFGESYLSDIEQTLFEFE